MGDRRRRRYARPCSTNRGMPRLCLAPPCCTAACATSAAQPAALPCILHCLQARTRVMSVVLTSVAPLVLMLIFCALSTCATAWVGCTACGRAARARGGRQQAFTAGQAGARGRRSGKEACGRRRRRGHWLAIARPHAGLLASTVGHPGCPRAGACARQDKLAGHMGLSLTCRAARPLRGAEETCSCWPRLLATEARPAGGGAGGQRRVSRAGWPPAGPRPRALCMPTPANCPCPAPGRLACRLGPLRESGLHSCPPRLLGLSGQAATERCEGFGRSGRSSPRRPTLCIKPAQRARQLRELPATTPWRLQVGAPVLT